MRLGRCGGSERTLSRRSIRRMRLGRCGGSERTLSRRAPRRSSGGSEPTRRAHLSSHGRMGSVAELTQLPVGEEDRSCLLDLLGDPELDTTRISDAVAAIKRRFAG